MTKAGNKILDGLEEALAFSRGEHANFVSHKRTTSRIRLRQDWSELARYAEACVDLDLTPQQELQRLAMLRAMIAEMSAGIDVQSAAPAERPRTLGDELLEGVREIKAGGGNQYQVEVPKK